nr:signal recognition particle receptor subunit alpha [Seculamonas ecuadoriensis]
MIDHFVIMTHGGLVLWSKSMFKVQGNPVNKLIGFLLEARGGAKNFEHDVNALKWISENDLEIILVAVHRKSLTLLYLDDLLTQVRDAFVNAYRSQLRNPSEASFADFDAKFDRILAAVETQYFSHPKKFVAPTAPAPAKNTKPSTTTPAEPSADATETPDATTDEEPSNNASPPPSSPTAASPPPAAPSSGTKSTNNTANARVSSPPPAAASSSSSSPAPASSSSSSQSPTKSPPSNAPLTAAERAKRLLAAKAGKAAPKAGQDKLLTEVFGKKAPKAKVMTKWDDKLSKADLDKLDKSERIDEAEMARLEEERAAEIRRQVQEAEARSPPRDNLSPFRNQSGDKVYGVDSIDDDDDDAAGAASSSSAGKSAGSGIFSFFKKITGTKPLEDSDLQPVLEKVREKMMTKNVAQDITEMLVDSIRKSLLGKKLGTFKGVTSTVHEALEEAIRRILTPRQNIDILRDVARARENGRPFTIVFVGVNGVGKSTSLAKVCYWLKSQNLKCMIAACDTFRSGAVEQLRVHQRALDVSLFHRGYGKDPAAIAKEAIAEATRNAYDVVLIDTAGRMQDNTPLMEALAKLIHVNTPDLVVFVGEALVGNDAVDQLTKFNQALADLSPGREPRLIDGIVLTKYDTVDDKVGAAISMVYTTGQPILFVGIGQTYTDLRVLNVDRIVEALLR